MRDQRGKQAERDPAPPGAGQCETERKNKRDARHHKGDDSTRRKPAAGPDVEDEQHDSLYHQDCQDEVGDPPAREECVHSTPAS